VGDLEQRDRTRRAGFRLWVTRLSGACGGET
jgi:hypothetical protein